MKKENSGNSTEMPKYQSHKQVWALKIKKIRFTDGGGAIIIPEKEGFAPFEVDHAYCKKHSPEAGGYYVVYKDGYKSWSPADAFESGYTRMEKSVLIDQSVDVERLSRFESIQIARGMPCVTSSIQLIKAASDIERYLIEGTTPE